MEAYSTVMRCYKMKQQKKRKQKEEKMVFINQERKRLIVESSFGNYMNLPLNIQNKKKILVRTLQKHGVLQAGIFGSYARGTAKKKSDVDLLVKTKPGLSLFDFAGIKVAVEEVLGKEVDLVEYSTLKPRLRERILQEEVRIL